MPNKQLMDSLAADAENFDDLRQRPPFGTGGLDRLNEFWVSLSRRGVAELGGLLDQDKRGGQRHVDSVRS